jgi:hypothetical protein
MVHETIFFFFFQNKITPPNQPSGWMGPLNIRTPCWTLLSKGWVPFHGENGSLTLSVKNKIELRYILVVLRVKARPILFTEWVKSLRASLMNHDRRWLFKTSWFRKKGPRLSHRRAQLLMFQLYPAYL